MTTITDVRKGFVYPGHPLVIAVAIMEHYDSLEAANKRYRSPDGWSCPEALSDGRIPGAGGCVYSALDLLNHIRIGHRDIDGFVEAADELWGDIDGNVQNYPEKHKEGLDNAAQHQARFRELAAGWDFGEAE